MISAGDFDREDVMQALSLSKTKTQLVESLQAIGKKGEASALAGGYSGDVASMLRNSSPEVVAAACEALGYMGQAAEQFAPDIADKLESPKAEVRAAAANALGMLGTVEQYKDKLTKMFEDKYEAAKCAAIGALGQSGTEEQASPIAAFLRDSSPVVVAAAVQALGELGPAGESKAADIAKQLEDDRIRYAAVCALSSFSDSVCESYIEVIIDKCLTDKDCMTRTVAYELLARLGEAVAKASMVPKITALLKHENVGVKCAAAMALGGMGDKATDQADAIKALLSDKEEDTSELYLTIGGGSMRAPPSSRRPKCAALVALGMMGAGTTAAACADALSDENWEVKMCALECLAQMGSAGKEQSSKITTCLEDDVFVVRMKACECLGALKAEDGLHNVTDLFLEDKAPAVRQAALLALAEAGDVASGYASDVFKCMNDSVNSVQAAAITCLGSMGENGQSFASIIASKIFDEDVAVRAAACGALGKLGDYGAAFAEEVASCLQDGAPEVRMQAAKALGNMGSEGAPFMGDVQLAINDAFPEVSVAAQEAVLALENK